MQPPIFLTATFCHVFIGNYMNYIYNLKNIKYLTIDYFDI